MTTENRSFSKIKARTVLPSAHKLVHIIADHAWNSVQNPLALKRISAVSTSSICNDVMLLKCNDGRKSQNFKNEAAHSISERTRYTSHHYGPRPELRAKSPRADTRTEVRAASLQCWNVMIVMTNRVWNVMTPIFVDFLEFKSPDGSESNREALGCYPKQRDSLPERCRAAERSVEAIEMRHYIHYNPLGSSLHRSLHCQN